MRLVHKGTLAYLKRLTDDDLDRQLRVSWLPRMSVRQVLLYIIAHETRPEVCPALVGRPRQDPLGSEVMDDSATGWCAA
jgi:hypothetical protein